MFDKALDEMVENSNKLSEKNQNDYEDTDGILHCGVCGEPKQLLIECGDSIGSRMVGRQCKCIRDKRELELKEAEDKKRKEEIKDKRAAAFSDSTMRGWTFASSDRANDDKLHKAMLKYTYDFDKYYEQGKGLILYGSVGTGKSFLAGCIANAVLEQNKSVYMTTFGELIMNLSETDQKGRYIKNNICNVDLLVIDDLGTERDTAFGMEQVFNVIDRRGKTKKPLIVTTNLSLNELTKCKDVPRKRIYDRVMEMCFPVEVEGESRRLQKARQEYTQMKLDLGL